MGYDLHEQLGQMHIGVAEIMDTGHVTLAETLCRIYCSDPGNRVFLFTLEAHSVNLGFLSAIYPNLAVVARPIEQKLEDFLHETGNFNLDRIYLVTLTKHFRVFSNWAIMTRLFLVIHNTDEWFGLNLSESVKKFIFSASRTFKPKLWIYFFKDFFIFPRYKKNILKKVRESDGRLVILSKSVQRELNRLGINIPSEVVPFSVFDPSLVSDEVSSDRRLRICIPGILSQYRRNYVGLLDTLESQMAEYKELFIIDMLGGLQTDNPLDDHMLILDKAEAIRNKGFSVIVHHERFIPPIEYNRELVKADIVLGNMNVELNRYSVYGKTKETGIPFAMIRAAKPGIIPDSYSFPDELASSILIYHDFADLVKILVKLVSDRGFLEDLKAKALENSKKFSPEAIYKQMMINQDN
jgi:hypothetical protein